MTEGSRQDAGDLRWALLDGAALRFLAEASVALIGQRHVDGLLHDAVQPLVPSQADVAILDVVSEDGGHARVFSRTSNPQHDSALRGRAALLVPSPGNGSSPAALALHEGRVVLHGEFGDGGAGQAHSILALPVRHGGRVIGALSVIGLGRHDRYGRPSVTLLEEYVRRLGLAIVAARTCEAGEHERMAAVAHREVLQDTVAALERSLADACTRGDARDEPARSDAPAIAHGEARAIPIVEVEQAPQPLRTSLRRGPGARLTATG